MGGFLSGLGSNRRVQAILLGWVLPALLVSFLFVIIVLPEVRTSAAVVEVRRAVAVLAINRTLFVVLATTALATLMSLNRISLYRLLEGWSWPRFLSKWRVNTAHRPHWEYLLTDQAYRWRRAELDREEEQIRRLVEAQTVAGRPTEHYERELNGRIAGLREEVADLQLKREEAATRRRQRGRDPVPLWARMVPRRGRPAFMPRPVEREGAIVLPTYPEGVEGVMPTRVGNALRKMETYGNQFFGVDPLNLFYELYSAAPSTVRGAVEEAELECDAVVCLWYSVGALGTTAALGGLWRAGTGPGSTRLWVVAGLCLAAMWMLQRLLLTAIDEWSAAYRAMINTGRKPLREKLGLPEPQSAEEEVAMWGAYLGTMHHGDNESRRALAAFESRANEKETRVALRFVADDAGPTSSSTATTEGG